MRALVTGGRGFVGTWLTEHLQAHGDDVVPTGEEADVRDGAKVGAVVNEVLPDAVYHLAGQASVGRSWEEPAATYLVNTLGTVNVLNACRKLNPMPRVLVVSSAEIYGHVQPTDLPLSETAPARPLSPYAASKAAAEVAASQAARGWGLPVVIARPFNHIGPGQGSMFAVAALAKRTVEAKAKGTGRIEMGNPAPRRDLTDVRDVVRAYRMLALRGEPGEVYNVCSGTEVVIGDLARRLIDLCGGGIDLVTGAVEMRPHDVPALRGDATKLRQATGWQPEIPLDQTLLDVLAHWRERVDLA